MHQLANKNFDSYVGACLSFGLLTMNCHVFRTNNPVYELIYRVPPSLQYCPGEADILSGRGKAHALWNSCALSTFFTSDSNIGIIKSQPTQ